MLKKPATRSTGWRSVFRAEFCSSTRVHQRPPRAISEAEYVENAAALTSVFGRWPSFHDAEVLSMRLERAGEGGPSLDARIHVFLMNDQVDERGYYILTHHTLVEISFANIVLRQLRWFTVLNSLRDLRIAEVVPAENEGHRFTVCFSSNWGVEADLLCDRVIVRSVEPFTVTR